jgi:hypothetical protein
MNSQPFAHIPGVRYPAPKPVKRPPLPQGCPPYVASLRLLAPWIQAAGLWPTPPSLRTLERWKQYGLIAIKKGATGCRMIDVAATLALLRPTD